MRDTTEEQKAGPPITFSTKVIVKQQENNATPKTILFSIEYNVKCHTKI